MDYNSSTVQVNYTKLGSYGLARGNQISQMQIEAIKPNTIKLSKLTKLDQIKSNQTQQN